MAVRTAVDLANVSVVVPARGSTDGKSRLGEALDAEERLNLVVGMLVETLRVVAGWSHAHRTYVVSTDIELRRLVRETGTGAVAIDQSSAGLNGALIDGRERAVQTGATAVLYLPADLPHLDTAALDSLLEAADAALAAGSGRPVVVVAAADARVGTNALLVAPPSTIDPHFGEESLEAHIRAAAAAEASVQVVAEPALGFDLDTPEDLERLEFARLVELQTLGQAALDALDTLRESRPRSEVA